MDNQQQTLRELALFAGAGGGILGGHLLGWRTVAAVEYNAYARSVLLARQNDGTLTPFPIWDDVRTFDGKPWKGLIDVVSGGFPCQDISIAGNGNGIDGERSGLWRHQIRILDEIRPQLAYVENSPMLTSRGINRVLGDLAELGFDAKWGVLGASDVSRDHHRKRIWILGYSMCDRLERVAKTENSSTSERNAFIRRPIARTHSKAAWDRYREKDEPRVVGTIDGLAHRMDRLKAIGNGQVPRVAATAWSILNARR